MELLESMLFGYELNSDSELSGIIAGGGLMSMVSVSFVVLIAYSYSSIFEGTNMLKNAQGFLVKMSK